jgi:hypothetical protein
MAHALTEAAGGNVIELPVAELREQGEQGEQGEMAAA